MSRPDLCMVGGSVSEGQVIRRLKFERAHPEAVILPPCAGRWRAVLPAGLIPGDGTRTTLGAWDLCDLLNQLDAICPVDDAEPPRQVGLEPARRPGISSVARAARAWETRYSGYSAQAVLARERSSQPDRTFYCRLGLIGRARQQPLRRPADRPARNPARRACRTTLNSPVPSYPGLDSGQVRSGQRQG